MIEKEQNPVINYLENFYKNRKISTIEENWEESVEIEVKEIISNNFPDFEYDSLAIGLDTDGKVIIHFLKGAKLNEILKQINE